MKNNMTLAIRGVGPEYLAAGAATPNATECGAKPRADFPVQANRTAIEIVVHDAKHSGDTKTNLRPAGRSNALRGASGA